jgi:hypothetical protein
MSAVVIASDNPDFAQLLAEQVEQELVLTCSKAPGKTNIPQQFPDVRLIITDGEPMAEATTPVLSLPAGSAPFRMNEVLARARALLACSLEVIDMGNGYRFLPRARQITSAQGTSVELTDREMGLLAALLQAGEDGVPKDALLSQVWGFEADLNTHTLETHVYRLRSKVREAFGTEMIAAIEGGYKLEL